MTTIAQAKADPATRMLQVIKRIAVIVVLASALTWGIKQTALREQSGDTSGFGAGIMHGILMPCALPQLLLGHDVTIYAANNTGRTYKLGYTVGVNGCGALFFGLLYWRFNRWRKGRNGANGSPAA